MRSEERRPRMPRIVRPSPVADASLHLDTGVPSLLGCVRALPDPGTVANVLEHALSTRFEEPREEPVDGVLLAFERQERGVRVRFDPDPLAHVRFYTAE